MRLCYIALNLLIPIVMLIALVLLAPLAWAGNITPIVGSQEDANAVSQSFSTASPTTETAVRAEKSRDVARALTLVVTLVAIVAVVVLIAGERQGPYRGRSSRHHRRAHR